MTRSDVITVARVAGSSFAESQLFLSTKVGWTEKATGLLKDRSNAHTRTGYEFLLITAEKLTEGPAGELFSRRRADTLAGMRLLPQLSACRYQRHPATLASISSWKRFSTTVVRGPAAADATLAFSRPCAGSWRDSAQGRQRRRFSNGCQPFTSL